MENHYPSLSSDQIRLLDEDLDTGGLFGGDSTVCRKGVGKTDMEEGKGSQGH